MTLEHSASIPRRTKIFAFCLFFLAGFAAYSNILGSFFLSDDFAQIGRVLAGDLSVTWGSEHGGFFRPLFVLSLLADAAVWGRNPLGYHLTNVVLHVLNAFLVLLISWRLTERAGFAPGRRRWLSYAGGLVFLLHPSHTEAVTWISGRPDLLSALFCLAALLFFDSYERSSRRAHLALALSSHALALLAKEAAVCLPLLVFTIGCYGAARGLAFRRGLRSSLPFVLLLAAYVVARALALGTLVGGYGAGRHLNFTHSMIVSQLLRFFLRAVFPAVALRPFPFLESRALSLTLIVTGCVAVISLAAALARAGGRRRLLGFLRVNGFLWLLAALFLAALLPAINLRLEVFSTQGERFLYLPSVFSSVALAFVILKAAGGGRLRLAILCATLALYSASLWRTNRRWAEASLLSRRVLNQVVSFSERAEVLILNLPDNFGGVHLYRNGLPEALQRFQGEKHFRRVHILAWHNLHSAPDAAAELTEEAGVYTLRLTGAGAAFERFNEPTPEFIEILERSEKHMRLRPRDPGTRDIFYFSGGEMFKVAAPFSPSGPASMAELREPGRGRERRERHALEPQPVGLDEVRRVGLVAGQTRPDRVRVYGDVHGRTTNLPESVDRKGGRIMSQTRRRHGRRLPAARRALKRPEAEA